MSLINVVSQNMAHLGLYTPNGDPDTTERWHGLIGQIRQRRPDILQVQEVGQWNQNNRTPIAQAEQALGLRLVGIVTTAAGGGTGLLINPNTVSWDGWEDRYPSELHHGFRGASCAFPAWTPPGRDQRPPDPYSAAAAAQEAQILVARVYCYGGLGFLGGDINHFPLDNGAIPKPHQIPLYNRSSRWLRNEDGTYVPNRAVARVLTTGGLRDVAALVVERDANPALLGPPEQGSAAPTSSGSLRRSWLRSSTTTTTSTLSPTTT